MLVAAPSREKGSKASAALYSEHLEVRRCPMLRRIIRLALVAMLSFALIAVLSVALGAPASAGVAHGGAVHGGFHGGGFRPGGGVRGGLFSPWRGCGAPQRL